MPNSDAASSSPPALFGRRFWRILWLLLRERFS
jgi:hypothetical protein